MTYDIVNNAEKTRYEITVDGHTAFSSYRHEEPDVIEFLHTEVPEALGGRGLAGAIVKHALDDARARNLGIRARCAYVASYVRKHPEYEDLLRG